MIDETNPTAGKVVDIRAARSEPATMEEAIAEWDLLGAQREHLANIGLQLRHARHRRDELALQFALYDVRDAKWNPLDPEGRKRAIRRLLCLQDRVRALQHKSRTLRGQMQEIQIPVPI